MFFVYSLCNLYEDTLKKKRSLLMSMPVVKQFWREFLPGSRDLQIRVRRRPRIRKPWPGFAYSPYDFDGATMKIKGSLLMSMPTVERFLVENFSSALSGPNVDILGAKTE